MVQASDLSLQPGSSPFPRDEEAIERAFWKSTPTALEELRQGTEDECQQAVSKDQDSPNDPLLSLSTQQSRLIRQTWASAAGSIGRGFDDGETQTSARPKHRNRRGGAWTASTRPDSTTSNIKKLKSTDKSMFFVHLKNIEKVSKTVDERIQKRKVQKEWSTKVISETARLRDDLEEGLLKVNVDMNTTNNKLNPHGGERSPSKDNADMVAQVEEGIDSDNDDNDLLGGRGGTPQQSEDDGERESMEEEVPTSQSQERYLTISGSLRASCAPINRSPDQRQPPTGCPGDF